MPNLIVEAQPTRVRLPQLDRTVTLRYREALDTQVRSEDHFCQIEDLGFIEKYEGNPLALVTYRVRRYILRYSLAILAAGDLVTRTVPTVTQALTARDEQQKTWQVRRVREMTELGRERFLELDVERTL